MTTIAGLRALLRQARDIARARGKGRLRYRVYGGLSASGSELAFFGGRYHHPDEGEPFDDFAERVSDAVAGPVVLGGMPQMPVREGELEMRWRVEEFHESDEEGEEGE
jgi:hypothetical protein